MRTLFLFAFAFGVRPGSNFSPMPKPYHNEMPFHDIDFYRSKKGYEFFFTA